MERHGFSSDLPIEEIVQTYTGIDIRGKPLKKVMSLLAKIFDLKSQSLQPTYAQWSAHSMREKFSYLIDRIIALYEITEDNKTKVKKFFWELVDALKVVRQAKKPWPDFVMNNQGKKEQKNLSPAINRIDKPSKNLVVSEVTLYKYDDNNIFLSSYAYFENEDLVVDYGKLSGDHEDEYYIKVKHKDLLILYNKIEIDVDSKSELLSKIFINFNGKDCFLNFELFLKENNILFDYSLRHG
jgi:hypothetical protein